VDPELRQLLSAIAAENDRGEPATLAHLTAVVKLPVDRLDQLLKHAQEGALVGRIGKATDHQGSPIERAPEGWMLLSAGQNALGLPPSGPLDPSPLD
jgi:hypothetical protein